MQVSPLSIFLSPHFDDIALSCGGIAARLSQAGVRCVGLTLFAAPPPDGGTLSPFAQALHERWERSAGMEMGRINEVRRREEASALKLLGLKPVWFEHGDAPYRQGPDGRHPYASDEELLAEVSHWERQTLAATLAEEIAGLASRELAEMNVAGRVRVFAPLGIGHHVDHQLTFWAARMLGPRLSVLYYEDYPYASLPGALERRLDEVGAGATALVTPITDLIGLKIAAVARYKSQLDVLFGSADRMPSELRAYCEQVAGDAGWPTGEYAERVWVLPPVYKVRAARLVR